MITTIKSTHEEEYKDNKRLGIVTNFNLKGERINSFPYIFNETPPAIGLYIFFETIVEMIDYSLYGGLKINRAYLKEDDFDKLYDKIPGIEGVFNDYLIFNTKS